MALNNVRKGICEDYNNRRIVIQLTSKHVGSRDRERSDCKDVILALLESSVNRPSLISLRQSGTRLSESAA